jgi:Glyoxalase/Bleomycin resistance protein/Dioxygenase superfamily
MHARVARFRPVCRRAPGRQRLSPDGNLEAMSSPATATSGKVAKTVLDHVAVAVEQWSDAWPRYVQQLGGAWHSGGINIGFGPAQLSFANEARVEVLQPWEHESNPFLRRFLDHSGPGPHHLTFKVPDIEATLGQARGAGFDPVGVQLSDPHWREAFIHPRQATGVVVQVAQAEFNFVSPAPEGFPTGPVAPAAALVRVTHAVRGLDTALELFHVLLGGEMTRRGVASDGTWDYVDLSWPSPLALRLVAPTAASGATSALRTWLGDRPGRVHHLAFDLPDPPTGDPSMLGEPPETPGTEIPGVIPGPGRVWELAPEATFGTRLVLRWP